jgi:hypothetical protein
MIDLALDPASRDMVFVPGAKGVTLLPIDGAARVAQAIGIRLRTWLGEWFLDQTHGVPYLEEVLDKGRSPEIIEAVLRAQILDVQGVQGIEAFSLEIDARNRRLQVNFSARSAEGLAVGAVTVG